VEKLVLSGLVDRPGASDKAVADGLGVSRQAVARIREELELSKRRRLAGRDHLVYVRQVLASLVREEAPRGIGSFVRPVRRPVRREDP
jgi:hypothetical protein